MGSGEKDSVGGNGRGGRAAGEGGRGERGGEGEHCGITGAGRLKVLGSDDFTGTAQKRNTGR